jgi:hypothetical protein
MLDARPMSDATSPNVQLVKDVYAAFSGGDTWQFVHVTADQPA